MLSVQCKIDGCSLCVVYVDGKFSKLITRGDGLVGDDITENGSKMVCFPKTIGIMGVVYVRGEGVLCDLPFETHFKPKGFANARNTTTGLLKGKSSAEDLEKLSFIAYKLHSDKIKHETEMEEIEGLKELGFEVPKICELVLNKKDLVELYKKYDSTIRDTLPYKTDGLVLILNKKADQEKLPNVGGRPGHAIAVKPSPKKAVTKVLGIEWEMGLSGAYSPVALVEPCDLDGTTCKRVNMFNLDFLQGWVNKGFDKGCMISIVRTGDILPHIDNVLVGVQPSE